MPPTTVLRRVLVVICHLLSGNLIQRERIVQPLAANNQEQIFVHWIYGGFLGRFPRRLFGRGFLCKNVVFQAVLW